LPGNDLSLLIDAAHAAGQLAVPFWCKSPEIWDKGDGAGPVTEADIAVDNMLRSNLRASRPDYGWLSEETDDNTDRLSHEHVFIVDPIDGTRAFISGEKTWSHSLAIARNGQITAAVVYLPMREELFTAERGNGAYLNETKIHQSGRTEVTGATLLSARPNLDPKHWHGTPPALDLHFRTSLAYRLALVAQGRYDAMLTLRNTWEWDVAAGSLIATEAGARATDSRGDTPSFNNEYPAHPGFLAATSAIHAPLKEALK
jgi:myo-inositol-1(or 4)-monophosphatase